MSREDQARKNRERFPHIARVVDELRRDFGADVKLTWAIDDGNEVGRKNNSDDFVVALPYVPAHTILKKKQRQHG